MHDLDLNLTQCGYDCLVPITYGASLLSYFTVYYLAAIEIKHEDAKVSHPQNNCRLAYTAMLGAFTSRAVARFVTKLNTRVTTACPSRFRSRSSAPVKSYKSCTASKSCIFSSYAIISGVEGGGEPQKPLSGSSPEHYEWSIHTYF